jgi:biotin operon repressor
MTEQRVLAALQHGRWQTIGDLAVVLRVPRRDVEAAVEALRLGGAPVIAGGEGVKLTTNAAELEAYIQGRRLRTAAIHRGTMALRSTLRRMKYGSQEPLWRDVA